MTGPATLRRRLGAGLLAGAIAIGLNTVALKLADYVPLATAHGGLLRLVSPWIGPVLQQTGLAALWSALGGPPVNTPLFPRSEEHTSELQSLMRISYADFCFKKQKTHK